MDILKQELAPVSAEAWEEIRSEARRVLNVHLSARKFIEVVGPKGWDYAAVPVGRLNIPGNQDKKGVIYGINKVQPLVEPRISFHLNIWELDNLARGAIDIGYESHNDKEVRLFFTESFTLQIHDPATVIMFE